MARVDQGRGKVSTQAVAPCRYLMPTLQPYGGWGWYCACLFPPSAVSLFANVLVKVEAGGLGLQWESLGRDVTSESSFPFSSRFVLVALLVDCVLYSLLTAYCDKVWRPLYYSTPRVGGVPNVGQRPVVMAGFRSHSTDMLNAQYRFVIVFFCEQRTECRQELNIADPLACLVTFWCSAWCAYRASGV